MTPADEPEPIAFDPVPSASTRHDGWTAERQREFIAALARCGIVSAAAKAVGMAPKSAYRLRARPAAESFAAAWAVALDEGGLRARGAAIRRALEGEAVPIFYRGLQVGERRRYDNRLLLSALRSHCPDARAAAASLDDFLGWSHFPANAP